MEGKENDGDNRLPHGQNDGEMEVDSNLFDFDDAAESVSEDLGEDFVEEHVEDDEDDCHFKRCIADFERNDDSSSLRSSSSPLSLLFDTADFIMDFGHVEVVDNSSSSSSSSASSNPPSSSQIDSSPPSALFSPPRLLPRLLQPGHRLGQPTIATLSPADLVVSTETSVGHGRIYCPVEYIWQVLKLLNQLVPLLKDIRAIETKLYNKNQANKPFTAKEAEALNKFAWDWLQGFHCVYGDVLFALQQQGKGLFYGKSIKGDQFYVDMHLALASIGVEIREENVPRPFFVRLAEDQTLPQKRRFDDDSSDNHGNGSGNSGDHGGSGKNGGGGGGGGGGGPDGGPKRGRSNDNHNNNNSNNQQQTSNSGKKRSAFKNGLDHEVDNLVEGMHLLFMTEMAVPSTSILNTDLSTTIDHADINSSAIVENYSSDHSSAQKSSAFLQISHKSENKVSMGHKKSEFMLSLAAENMWETLVPEVEELPALSFFDSFVAVEENDYDLLSCSPMLPLSAPFNTIYIGVEDDDDFYSISKEDTLSKETAILKTLKMPQSALEKFDSAGVTAEDFTYLYAPPRLPEGFLACEVDLPTESSVGIDRIYCSIYSIYSILKLLNQRVPLIDDIRLIQNILNPNDSAREISSDTIEWLQTCKFCFGSVLIDLQQRQEGSFYCVTDAGTRGDVIYVDMDEIFASMGIQLKEENVPFTYFKRHRKEETPAVLRRQNHSDDSNGSDDSQKDGDNDGQSGGDSGHQDCSSSGLNAGSSSNQGSDNRQSTTSSSSTTASNNRVSSFSTSVENKLVDDNLVKDHSSSESVNVVLMPRRSHLDANLYDWCNKKSLNVARRTSFLMIAEGEEIFNRRSLQMSSIMV